MKRQRGFSSALLARAAASIDRAVTLAVRSSPAPEGDPTLGNGHEPRVRALRAILDRYAALDTSGFYPEPRAIEPIVRARREAAPGLERSELSWESLREPFLPELGSAFLRTGENRVATARLLARKEPRPVAILIHGYLLGRPSVEERLWPIQLLDELGFDSALFVLPFHGSRANPERRGRPEFPGREPRFANEGFRQAVTDLRELARFLVRRGHPAVGVMGMSLGAYTAALCATVEAELAFLVPIIPLASLADFALDHGDLPEAPEPRALEHRLLDEAYGVVSPVHRKPLVPSERVLVIGAKVDRITPLRHARRLATHFGAPLVTFAGSHLLQFGRAGAFAAVAEFLGRLRLGRT